jgi:hypothetical protein
MGVVLDAMTGAFPRAHQSAEIETTQACGQ